MTGTYDLNLVTLSVVIAVFASYVALETGGRVTAARGRMRPVWLWGGSTSMGMGIWAMHYVGMLAYRLPVPVLYDIPIVVASLLVAILASCVALYVVSRPRLDSGRLILGSLAMGGGIAGMHYIGMEAMRLPAMHHYDRGLVALSVLLAVVISFIALVLTFQARHEETLVSLRKVVSAIVMGSAIPVMHYTGMAAVSFEPAVVSRSWLQGVSIQSLDTMVLVVLTLALLSATIGSALLDRLFAANRLQLATEKRLRQVETERDEYLHSLLEVKTELFSDELRKREEFLSHLSHELRNPLGAIVQFVSILRDGIAGRLNKEQRDYVGIISRNAAVMEDLIGDLLDATRVRTGKLKIEPKEVSLAETVHAVLTSLRWTALESKVEVRATLDEDVPMAFADPTRIHQIILNLVHNALKFTPEGGSVEVRVSRFARDPSFLRVDVRDTGCGLTPELQKEVFTRLFQAPSRTGKSQAGLGLGLYICTELVQRQGGEIWVESEVDVGSTFSFTLPSSDQPDTGVLAGPDAEPRSRLAS